ncbi:aldehyde dehydrogenase domain-containing protein [Suillus paluster]|uniref:aldehyde dehydrogenase domain-containing protein n=1 Tax=Suillus paluster TaxID=48578 RepID=UPI001B881486|nr:aldehyde dehydrogenase domain-containing protein [Suillus paluster]KAG1736643.1 aldehyde dehydrogenase domain-containing protein [Suillus paluster]
MPSTFTHEFNAHAFKGKVSFSTGIFVNGQFQDGSDNTTIDVINPTTGKVITSVSEGTAKDVDVAVDAAQKAYDTVWGLNAPGTQRSILMSKLAALMQENADELAALEALDNGKTFNWAKNADVAGSIDCIRYYAGWADKISGQTQETTMDKLTYTRHEPIGVVGQIIPWNFPCTYISTVLMMAWKLGPALACGNTIVLKPSEFTPLTAIRMCHLINEAGFPPGVVNVITGYGHTVGNAISSHMHVDKVAFTGSTLVGRKIMEAAAKSNLKNVTLELGGKSPNIIYDDADLEQAVNWAAFGIFWNHGQTCCAGSRIFVQEGIYDEFLKRFTEKTRSLKVGDPFAPDTFQGPQVSEVQFNRIMSYIESGKQAGAKVEVGGERIGTEGYFIKPTIFTNVDPSMKIVQEEIFGPVGVVIKFKDEEDVIKQANDTVYGLAAAVFTQNLNRAINTAHKLKAGTAWINCVNSLHSNVPFGGFKQSGIGRELGEYALNNYTAVKAVHVNLGHKM